MSWGSAGSGAATGAGIGSFFGPIGMGIGAGAGALFGGLFGGDDDDKKKKDDDPTDITGDLAMLRANAGEDRAQGDDLEGLANPAIATSLNYLNSLAKGDQSAILGATRAQRGKIIDQYDSGRRAAMQFGPRGGGLNEAVGNSYIAEANQLSDVTSEAQTAAATQLGSFGAQLAGLGLNADQLANADLGTIIQAVLGQQQVDSQNRGQTMGMWGDIGSAAGSILGEYLKNK